MRRDLFRITYTGIETQDPREAIDTAISRVRDEFPEDGDSPTTLRVDTVKTRAQPPDEHAVTLNVVLARFLAAHEDPREMLDIVLADAEVEYGSRVLTLLSKADILGPNEYTDDFIERHEDELRRRGHPQLTES